MNYLQAIAQFYLAKSKFSDATTIARQMIALNPDNPIGRQLLQYINKNKTTF